MIDLISEKTEKSSRVVKLSAGASGGDIINTLAVFFSEGRYTFDISDSTTDALQEIIEDWYKENAGRRIAVRIEGLRTLVGSDYKSWAIIVSVFFQAELNFVTGAAEETDALGCLENIRIVVA